MVITGTPKATPKGTPLPSLVNKGLFRTPRTTSALAYNAVWGLEDIVDGSTAYNLRMALCELKTTWLGEDEVEVLGPDGRTIKRKVRGSLPKRLAQFLRLRREINLDKNTLSKVGEYLRRNMENLKGSAFDVVSEFDWDAGDFGDDGSCFWEDRSGARALLQDHGGLAFRVWDAIDKETWQGVARMWVLPKRGLGLVCFNAYGCRLETLTNALAKILRHNSYRISVTNRGEVSGLLYLNDGGTAIVLGTKPPPKKHLDFDLDTTPYEGDEGYDYCNGCEQRFYTEELWSAPDYNAYCQECWSMRFFDCDCGRTGEASDSGIVDYEQRCSRCLESCTYCEGCGMYHSEPHVEGGEDD